jgi:glycosyltransferase involved in cell wall biosynthesis
VTEFVEAARLVRANLPQTRFQLLGPIDEGNRTAISRNALESWVGEGIVEYLGTTDDVRPFIAASSTVVLPSYREGLPRSLLEAAAMGRPLIATDAPGCRDVVDDGVNGYLCAVADGASLADAMRRFVNLSYEQRLAMGESARRKVQERFSEELVVATYLEVLAGLNKAESGA